MTLPNYINLCNAIVLLMKPLVEVVVHDLKSQTIIYIKGDISNRQVGDPSLLDLKKDKNEDLDKVVYTKMNFDGRLVKSISLSLEDHWLVCLNCDVSIFHKIQELSQLFLDSPLQEGPESLFKNDWKEKLHRAIHLYVEPKGWSIENLSRFQKIDIVRHLFYMNAFNERQAADYIARLLDMGRATIFKYLKELRSNDDSTI